MTIIKAHDKFDSYLKYAVLEATARNCKRIQDVFHVYLNKFEIAVTHLLFMIN